MPAIVVLAGALLIVRALEPIDVVSTPAATESGSPVQSSHTTQPSTPVILPPDPGPDVTSSVQPEPVRGGPPAVTVVNSGADDEGVYASGLVTGATGEGGVCTLTATSTTGETLTARIEALATPAAVNCGVLHIPVPSGTWKLVLDFRSDSAQASSDAVEVVRP